MTTASRDDRRILSVSELNRTVSDLLGASLPLLWVEGEISNIARPRSGHVYFSLKDDGAQVRCALFRNKARLVAADLDNGARVQIRARVGLYAARGDYQLIVEHVEAAGDGALQRAYDALKRRLDGEGLFDQARKQPLPDMPQRIGVITSATGAAVRDVLHVLARRYPLAHVRIYPVPVQGAASVGQIVAALARLGRRRDCDLALLVRGGGSLEDLAAFNDERVARAIDACPVPIVAGVGHEVDVTIADLVADVRAATPSAAAECACPDISNFDTRVSRNRRALHTAFGRIQRHARQRLEYADQRLARQHPRRRLEAPMQRVDRAEQRLRRVMQARLGRPTERRRALAARLGRVNPGTAIARQRQRVDARRDRLVRVAVARLDADRKRLAGLGRALASVSPLATLERGYAIAQRDDDTIVRDSAALRVGERVRLRLARGRLDCEVIATGDDP